MTTPSTILLEQITAQNAVEFKTVRLAALLDTPSAFASTYERETLLTDEEWLERACKWSGPESNAYLARDGRAYCGIGAGVLADDNKSQVYLLSMWVAPTNRRRGIGRILVNAILNWAQEMSAVEIQLDVGQQQRGGSGFLRKSQFQKNRSPCPSCT